MTTGFQLSYGLLYHFAKDHVNYYEKRKLSTETSEYLLIFSQQWNKTHHMINLSFACLIAEPNTTSTNISFVATHIYFLFAWLSQCYIVFPFQKHYSSWTKNTNKHRPNLFFYLHIAHNSRLNKDCFRPRLKYCFRDRSNVLPKSVFIKMYVRVEQDVLIR